jgi:hypothetical protein
MNPKDNIPWWTAYLKLIVPSNQVVNFTSEGNTMTRIFRSNEILETTNVELFAKYLKNKKLGFTFSAAIAPEASRYELYRCSFKEKQLLDSKDILFKIIDALTPEVNF